MSVLWLKARLWLTIALMFSILYGFLVLIMCLTGAGTPIIFALLAFFIVSLQFLAGPKIVEWSMRVKYVSPAQYPKLHRVVEELTSKSNIPKPKVGISRVPIPNAFAFGKSKRDGRVCVTEQLMHRLDEEELRAVLAHEISHIKHRDIVAITMLSVIPMMCYFMFWSFLWGGMGRRSGAQVIIAMAALAVYFVTNLLVLYASRIREYYADRGSGELTKKPHTLASALYRITIDTSKIDRRRLKRVEGMKAFFATDPSRARRELTDLRKADLDLDGHLDAHEVDVLAQKAKVTFSDNLLELFSSHPNVVKRIVRLRS